MQLTIIPVSNVISRIGLEEGVFDGATVSALLTRTPSCTGSLSVALNGLVQTIGEDFTVSGQTITFKTPPAQDAYVSVKYEYLSLV